MTHKLVNDVAPRYMQRNGGYNATRKQVLQRVRGAASRTEKQVATSPE